jgi:predicted aminopeptidase
VVRKHSRTRVHSRTKAHRFQMIFSKKDAPKRFIWNLIFDLRSGLFSTPPIRAVYFVLLGLTSGCNPFYALQAAYVESDILIRRQEIQEIIKSPDLDQSERTKLRLVLAAREFAEKDKFRCGGSFRYYTKIDGPVSWLLTAVKRDAFVPYTWWFPIVGTVPYKGFFSLDEAQKAEKDLQDKGLETSVRPVEAFSTLGWFDDPLLSPLLKRDEITLVETVFHEVVHSTLWIPGDVAFNESVAQFIALEQTVRFFSTYPLPELPQAVARAEHRRDSFKRFALLIDATYKELESIYSSEDSSEQKIAHRHPVYQKLIQDLRSSTPELAFIDEPNNAELMGVRFYTKGFDILGSLYEQLGGQVSTLMIFLEALSECHSNSPDLFVIVKSYISEEENGVLDAEKSCREALRLLHKEKTPQQTFNR